MYQYTSKDISRFWTKIAITANSDKCWEWQAGCTDSGYGHFMVGGRKGGTEKSHRVAWELTNGAIPDGLWVLHSCDNRKCCNPAHLFLGTNYDNVQDMMQKGRNSKGSQHAINHRGELNNHNKLTPNEVRYIRECYAAGNVTFTELGKRMSVNRTTISGIVKLRLWKHLA